jgi:hypothetical protein
MLYMSKRAEATQKHDVTSGPYLLGCPWGPSTVFLWLAILYYFMPYGQLTCTGLAARGLTAPIAYFTIIVFGPPLDLP